MNELELKNIFVDQEAGKDKKLALKKVAELLGQSNHLNVNDLWQGFLAREQESTTGFGNGVAIPHTKISGLIEPKVGIITFTTPIEWQSLDEKPVYIAIALLMSTGSSSKSHLHILAEFARKLMDDDFIKDLQKSRHNQKDLYKTIISQVNL